MEELFCLTKVGMEVMVNAAGQRDGSLRREEVHPFLAWLALAFRSSLSLRLEFHMQQTPYLLRQCYCTAFVDHRKTN